MSIDKVVWRGRLRCAAVGYGYSRATLCRIALHNIHDSAKHDEN